MQLTSKEISELSSLVKKTLTFSTINNLLKPVIKTEFLSALLIKAVGSKSNKTINNGAALEITKKILGCNDINVAFAEAKKKENMSRIEIANKLNIISKSLLEDKADFSKEISKAAYNLLSLKNSNLIQNEINNYNVNNENKQQQNNLMFLNCLNNCFDLTIDSIEVDYYEENYKVELLYVLYFSNNTKLELDIEFYSDSDYIEAGKSTLNGIALSSLSIDFEDIIFKIIENNYFSCIKENKEQLLLSEEFIKKISLLLNNI